MDLVQNLLIKIKKKLSMDLVHDRESMDPVQESGPWTRSKEGVHGPLVHVLSSPGRKATSECWQGIIYVYT